MESNSIQHMASGFAAGFASTIALYPLELLKTRMQVIGSRTGVYGSIRGAFTNILHLEGFQGLYRGVLTATISSSVSWGGYFFLYEYFKKINSPIDGSKLRPSDHLLSGTEAGACLVALFNPLWVVKTRLTLQGTVPSARQYRGIFDAFITMAREEGIAGFYRGAIPAMLLTSHGAIQFTVYEQLKTWGKTQTYWTFLGLGITSNSSVNSRISDSGRGVIASQDRSDGLVMHRQSQDQSPLLSVINGSLSKIVASMATYPYQVIKSKLQQGDTLVPRSMAIGASLSNSTLTPLGVITAPSAAQYKGTFDCVAKIWCQEGFIGFYRGAVPCSLRAAPAAGITLLVYEETLRLLRDKQIFHS